MTRSLQVLCKLFWTKGPFPPENMDQKNSFKCLTLPIFATKFWGHNLEKIFRLFGLNIFAPWYLDDWVKWCEQGSISDGINGGS